MENERTHLDLFSGIGGFALAARANGVRTVQFVEIDPRCRDFLAKAWPGVPVWDDIKTFHWNLGNSPQDGRKAGPHLHREHDRQGLGQRPDVGELAHSSEVEHGWRAAFSQQGQEGRTPAGWSGQQIWLLTGGVPCQPASRAGKQRGKEDHRWLWPEAIRVIAEVQPTWALLENPPGIGDVGLAGILSAVEAQGYEVRLFSIPACAVGAPHRRERFWIVAHATAARRNGEARREQHILGRTLLPARPADGGGCMGNSESERDQRRPMQTGRPEGPFSGSDRPIASSQWSNFLRLPCADGKVRRAPDDSFSLVDGLHRSLLGALGNSIVPQVAAEIIKAMLKSETVMQP